MSDGAQVMAIAFGGQRKLSCNLSHRPVDEHFSFRKRIERQVVSERENNAGAAAGQDVPSLELVPTVPGLCQGGVPEGPRGEAAFG